MNQVQVVPTKNQDDPGYGQNFNDRGGDDRSNRSQIVGLDIDLDEVYENLEVNFPTYDQEREVFKFDQNRQIGLKVHFARANI